LKIEGNIEVLLKLVEKMYGKNARKILEIIITSDEPIGEEAIGKMIGIKSNEARRIIQQLAGESIIRFRRLRKGDKGIHAWFLNEDQVEGILLTRLKKTLGKLKARLNFLRENSIFICPRCGRRYTFEEAMANDFRCIDDGELLEEYDPSEEIRFLEEKIREIEEDLRRAGAL
jgi:transcription initiation factor TFIIE subunit alpha